MTYGHEDQHPFITLKNSTRNELLEKQSKVVIRQSHHKIVCGFGPRNRNMVFQIGWNELENAQHSLARALEMTGCDFDFGVLKVFGHQLRALQIVSNSAFDMPLAFNQCGFAHAVFTHRRFDAFQNIIVFVKLQRQKLFDGFFLPVHGRGNTHKNPSRDEETESVTVDEPPAD